MCVVRSTHVRSTWSTACRARRGPASTDGCPIRRNRFRSHCDFPKPVTACEVRLTFDTDLTPPRVALNPYPRTLAKAYRVEGFDGTGWHALAEEGDNGLRLRVHRFEARRLAAVRVTVTETWGDRSARIFEVRVY